MFTWRHLLWLAICAGMVTCTVAAFRRKRPSLSRVLTTAMIISVLSEIVKIGSVIEMVPSANGVITGPYIPMNHLPLHFCSLQIIMIFIAKTTEDEKKRESLLSFMYSTALLGAIAALLMPSIFTTSVPVERAFVSPLSYQFFVFHSMLVALGIIIAISGEIKISPFVFALSMISKDEKIFSPEPALFMSILRIAALLGGFFSRSSVKRSTCSGFPCAKIST